MNQTVYGPPASAAPAATAPPPKPVEVAKPPEPTSEARVSVPIKARGEDPDAAPPRVQKDARPTGLHDRLRFDASLDFGFDSNVGNGEEYQTIAGKSTRGAARNQAARLGSVRQFRGLSEDPVLASDVYQRTITNDYRTAASSRSQAGLPLDIGLSLLGKPTSFSGYDLWLGYRFAQTFMLFAQSDDSALLPDAESYHLQQHNAVVSVSGKPRESINVSGSVEGFANFSGLSHFTPFLGGLLFSLSGEFIEPYRMRTRAAVNYRFRRAFDQEFDGYLSGNRLQIKLTQELRLSWVHPHFSYRLTYDNTGVLNVQSRLAVMYTPSSDPTAMPLAADLGTYSYFAPLTYHGHQFSLGANFLLPFSLNALAAFRYEYRGYTDPYFATYVGNAVGAIAALPAFTLPEEKRTDHLIALEAAVSRELPHNITLELAYGFMQNLSNIGNVLDNRTWSKHAILIAGRYSY